MSSLAKKIRAGTGACTDSGEDLGPDAHLCPSCGQRESGQGSCDEIGTTERYSGPVYDDLPTRASYFGWFDALVFTEYWYVPLGLAGLSALTLALIIPSEIQAYVVLGLLAVAAPIAALWYLPRRRTVGLGTRKRPGSDGEL